MRSYTGIVIADQLDALYNEAVDQEEVGECVEHNFDSINILPYVVYCIYSL